MEQLSHGQVMRVLYGLMAGMFLAAVESTVVATAAPTIAEDLGGIGLISWIFTAYMLTTTVSSALWGKLSDLVGRRPTYVASITIFIVGSLLCGGSQTMVQLIVFRGVQGIGGGGLTALSFTIMADVLAPRQRGRYVGYFSATVAAGSVVGPVVGGFLVDAFHWRAVFLVNLPLGILAGLIAANALRGVGGRREARLDIAGAVTISCSIISLLLAAVWGGDEYAWASTTIVGLLTASVVFAVVFVFVERRAAEPIIAMRLLSNRTLLMSMVMAATTSVPFQASIVYLPLFMQIVDDASVSGSGLRLAPLMITMSVGSILAGRRLTATGRYRRLLLGGLVLFLLVTVWLTTLGTSTSSITVVLMMVALGLAFGIVSPIINVAAQNAMPAADLGAASSALMTFRSLGATLGIAAVGSILSAQLRSGLADLPGAGDLDAGTLAAGPEAVRRLPDALRTEVVEVMADSIATAMSIGVPLLVISLIAWYFLPELSLRDHTEIEIAVTGADV